MEYTKCDLEHFEAVLCIKITWPKVILAKPWKSYVGFAYAWRLVLQEVILFIFYVKILVYLILYCISVLEEFVFRYW